MKMHVRPVEIHPALKGYIEKMWVFESSGRVPDDDLKLIVPNGLIKITIPFRNGISGKIKDQYLLTRENKFILIGVSDLPAVVDIENDAPSGCIGIEFSPKGAYRFFNVRKSELKNQIYPLADIVGSSVRQIEERMADTESLKDKISLIQKFLIQALSIQEDPVFDYCIGRIESSGGNITVRELERETGYTARWLNMKFDEKLGTSPKSIASILRFQYCYQSLLKSPDASYMKKEFLNHFYDQSHFIKEFKRFTGLSPKGFEKLTNNFGKSFYK